MSIREFKGEPPAQQPAPKPPTTIDVERLRSILPALIDALTDAVVVVDRGQRIVAANRRYLEAFGTDRSHIAGVLCTDAVHCPETASGVRRERCPSCDVFRSRKPLRRLRTVEHADGVPRRWEASFNPVGEGDDASHVVEVWRDVTERRQLEAEVAHSERLAALGVLAAGVAHEINNPLASMLTGVESLERWLERRRFASEDLDEAAHVLAMLDREILRCRETTNKLMLLAEPYVAAPGWVDVNQIVLDTVSLLRFLTRKHGIVTVERLDPALPQIWARDSGIRGACMNLMMNAAQAMPQGGTLTAATSHDDVQITLEIADTGTGIPAEYVDRIWEPFFTTKPVGEGTGLGLAVTHRVVARHGGRIRVETRPGQGSRFIMDLPIRGPGGE